MIQKKMSILDKIVEQTKVDIKKRSFKYSITDFTSFEGYERPRRSLTSALSKDEGVSVLAEIKKASPSKGLIRPDFDPVRHAEDYMNAGAKAISVLTDRPFFQGDLAYLEAVNSVAEVPLLRKDFIIDPYQVVEARGYGADAILLIVSILSDTQLLELIHAAKEESLECLVEAYSKEDIDRCPFDEMTLLGVNNRDLHTFEVDLHRGIDLLHRAPEGIVTVSESGLSTRSDMALLQKEGIDAALIGEYFMRQPDPGKALKQLIEF